jgi:hypothetical protein
MRHLLLCLRRMRPAGKPRCASVMERQITSPMPIPLSFVRKKASKILSGSSRPRRQSRTSTRTLSGLCFFERMKSFLGQERGHCFNRVEEGILAEPVSFLPSFGQSRLDYFE